MPKTNTRTTLQASTSVSAGSTQRSAVLDCTGADAGIITARITNGATGPTVQCEGRLMVAHFQSPAPSAAAEGTAATDWKQVATFTAGTANSATQRFMFRFGPEIAFAYMEFAGHTAQAVTVEAFATTVVY